MVQGPRERKGQKAKSRLEAKAAFGSGEDVAFLSSIDPLCMLPVTHCGTGAAGVITQLF